MIEPRGVKRGNIYQCGSHTIGCLDGTDKAQISWLFNGLMAVVCHADPPYNMKKAEVTGDRQSHAEFDAFQMRWWSVARANMVDNGSAYIWGKPEYLWRIWYMGGLKDSERLTFRNMIVWNKGSGQGMESEQHRMYPTATEMCLFFMIGIWYERGFSLSQNVKGYHEGFEPIRKYLLKQREKMGWDVKAMKTIVGHSDLNRDHWTTKSQWEFISKKNYNKLKEAANGLAFQRDYEDIQRDYEDIQEKNKELRPYHNNAHDSMTNVWKFGRVTGKTRWGHETPKPVEMIERVFKTSARENDIVYCPFLGSGADLIAAENTGRKLIGCDIEEEWVEVCLERWARWTGLEPVLIGNFYDDTGTRYIEVASVDKKKKIEVKRDLQLKLF